MFPRPALAALLFSAVLPAFARTADTCENNVLRQTPPAVNFRVDNDLLGGKDQDQGYSNGAAITLVSPNLTDYTGDPCLPWLARRVNAYLERLAPGRYEEQNMVLAINHSLYTPMDWTRSDLIPEDRPYAGLLYVGLGYNARDGHLLRHTQLQLGVVGPWAQGEEVQDAVHDATGDDKFAGWRHQLHNEPIINLVHERMARWPRNGVGNADGWGWDAIGHWGAALGNRATHANAGMELRFGWKLPDDFGSTPLRPAGENTAPRRWSWTGDWSAHAFVTTDARWVLRDITLDGNSFRDSHSVDKRPFVADIGFGFSVLYDRWKFALARYHRTREFDGQQVTPVYGSFTISRSL